MPNIHILQQDTIGRWFFLDQPLNTYATPEEALMADRDAAFVAEAKTANRQIWEGINKLVSLQREWAALDYANTLDVEGVVAAEVGAVVFDTATALVGVLNAGHATNMAKLL